MAEKDFKQVSEIPLDRMFLASELIPDAAESFLAASQKLNDVKDQADVVLDTSALLLPYGSGSGSLKQITNLFKKLVKDNRLHIPAQASREFVRNRPNKLSELQQGLLDKMSSFKSPDVPSYPILEGQPAYKNLLELLEQAEKLPADVKKATNRLVDAVRDWEWNDPVSTAYRSVIRPKVIVECLGTPEDIRSELVHRYELCIPPGYKDAAKNDGGVGDYLIWKTILQIGANNKRPLIFVSGEEKSDWQYSSKGSAFLPRVELVTEYRGASGGSMFYMIPLSGLLELFEGESSSVVELQMAEERLSDPDLVVSCPTCKVISTTTLGTALGSSASPICPSCSRRFHVNRTKEGVVTRPWGAPTRSIGVTEPQTESEEIVFCPDCSSLVAFNLGDRPGSGRWITCDECRVEFPARRGKGGSVITGRPAHPEDSSTPAI